MGGAERGRGGRGCKTPYRPSGPYSSNPPAPQKYLNTDSRGWNGIFLGKSQRSANRPSPLSEVHPEEEGGGEDEEGGVVGGVYGTYYVSEEDPSYVQGEDF